VQRTPAGFKAYLVASLAALGAILATTALTSEFHHNLLAWTVLTVLLAVTEGADLVVRDKSAQLGLSAGEAILLPMIVALSVGQVVWGAVIAIGVIGAVRARGRLQKELFNLAMYGTAAAAAAALYRTLTDGTGFTPLNALVAVLSIVVFAVLTHIFVSAAIALAEGENFLELTKAVGLVTLMNLGGNIVLGLFFAAAYLAAEWTVLLFPIPLLGLYWGLRAVLRQRGERVRLEQLHAASRALAAGADAAESLIGFLSAVETMVSASEALVILDQEGGPRWSAVRSNVIVANMEPVQPGPLIELLDAVRSDPSGRLLQDASAGGAAGADLSGGNLIAVPLRSERSIVGCLVARGRLGAEDFDEAEVRLVESLANELMLSLRSRRLFEQVVEEQERFSLMVEAVKDYAIFMIDNRGYIVSWNAGAERTFGYPTAEAMGKHFSQFYPSDAKEEVWDRELDVALRDGRSEAEGWRVRRDGTRFLANGIVAPVNDSSGQLRGFAQVVRDVTERARAEEEKAALETQLNQAQKLESVGQLAGGIAHDFNNILAVILNTSGFILEELDEKSEHYEDVQEIKSAGERAAALTRQLLVFSRRDAVEPEVLDLNGVVKGLEQLMRRAVGEGVVIDIDCAEDLAPIKADSGQLEQVLLNLAINARDAMEGGGTIRFATMNVPWSSQLERSHADLKPGAYIRLEVTDTGSGMPPHVIAKAFDPFFTTKPKGQGTGLGLATVYGIITRNGGRVEIHSKQGLGTTFEILLPVSEEDASVKEEETGPAMHRGDGETILLVEDEDSVRAVAKRILSRNGYNVVEASNGVEALAQVEATDHNVRLLLSDVVMPQMSGVELVYQLNKVHPEIKVIYMSGYSEAVFSGPQNENTSLIQKPFVEKDLLAKVRAALDS
jgi:PAS domain S-box-containing protein